MSRVVGDGHVQFWFETKDKIPVSGRLVLLSKGTGDSHPKIARLSSNLRGWYYEGVTDGLTEWPYWSYIAESP